MIGNNSICYNYIKKIPDFLANDMDTDELADFLEHIEMCPECKEELTIELLARDGINSLENGQTFDLNNELNIRLKAAYMKLKRHGNMVWFLYAVSGMDVVAALVAMILLVFNK